MLKKINIRRLYYHIRHQYLTMNNVVIGVALLIGLGWAWGSIGMMQRNYGLQKEIDSQTRDEKVIALETQNLAYEQKYYKTAEYQELAVREHLGLANPGEKELILPPNSQAAIDADKTTQTTMVRVAEVGNFDQWANFLFGGNRENLQK
jgi:hypothetical protein